MNYQVTMEKGEEVSTQNGVADDPFWRAAVEARASGQPTARVSMMAVHGIEYGEIKCSATVSIECVQSKPHIDSAALLAFKAAVEYTNAGMGFIAPGLPPLPSPP